MAKRSIPKNKTECNHLLKDIEQDLVDLFPKAVKKLKIKETSYGILVCYVDLTTDQYTPNLAILPESHRIECIADREVDYLWVLPELPTTDCELPKSASVRRKCNAVYEFLSADWDNRDEFDVILPFRKMIYRVCKTLNKFDWSQCLPVTDDFTVMASDWSTGSHIKEDAAASVPAKQKNRLLKQGLFFNSKDLPKPQEVPIASLKKIGKASVEDQLEFWRQQLTAFYDDQSCEAKDAKYTIKRVVSRITKHGKQGAETLLAFIEEKSDQPEMNDEASVVTGEWSSRSRALQGAIDGLKPICSKSEATEKRLWKCFEKSVKANKSAKPWGLLPSKLAFAIQAIFPKYSYWVTSDIVTGKLTSVAEIRRERREHGPSMR